MANVIKSLQSEFDAVPGYLTQRGARGSLVGIPGTPLIRRPDEFNKGKGTFEAIWHRKRNADLVLNMEGISRGRKKTHEDVERVLSIKDGDQDEGFSLRLPVTGPVYSEVRRVERGMLGKEPLLELTFQHDADGNFRRGSLEFMYHDPQHGAPRREGGRKLPFHNELITSDMIQGDTAWDFANEIPHEILDRGTFDMRSLTTTAGLMITEKSPQYGRMIEMLGARYRERVRLAVTEERDTTDGERVRDSDVICFPKRLSLTAFRRMIADELAERLAK